MPIFAFFHKSTKISKRFSGVDPPIITVFAYDLAIFNALISCSSLFRYSNLFRNGSATKNIFTQKNADFLTFIGYHGNVPFMQNSSSPYIALPIPEKLVKIHPVVPENSLLRGRLLTK